MTAPPSIFDPTGTWTARPSCSHARRPRARNCGCCVCELNPRPPANRTTSATTVRRSRRGARFFAQNDFAFVSDRSGTLSNWRAKPPAQDMRSAHAADGRRSGLQPDDAGRRGGSLSLRPDRRLTSSATFSFHRRIQAMSRSSKGAVVELPIAPPRPRTPRRRKKIGFALTTPT